MVYSHAQAYSASKETEDDANEKRKRPNPNNNFVRYLMIAFTCLVGFSAILFLKPSDVSSIETTSTVRRSKSVAKPPLPEGELKRSIKKAKTKAATKVEDEEEETKKELSKAMITLKDAKMEIEEAEEEAVSKSEEALKGSMEGLESNVKKALVQLLQKRKGYSPEKVKEIENEVVKRLESKVHEKLESEAELIAEDAEQDMDTVFENDVLSKVDAKGIETDVNAMREYFVEEAQREVDYVAKHIKDNMRDIAEEVEKDVISEKLNIEATNEELEDAELQVKVSDVITDISKNEQVELNKMGDDVSDKVKEVEKKVKAILTEFLSKQKGLSSSEAENIESEVEKRLEKEAKKQVKDKSNAIEEEVNQAVHIELDGIVEEDKFIIDRAKQLGLTAGSTNFKKGKDVDLIEGDIAGVKQSFDDYMKDITASITKDLKRSIADMVEKIEKDVLEEKGVKVSSTEMSDLVAREKNSITADA